MYDPIAIPMANLLGSLSSLADVILVAAVALLLLEFAIVIGAVIAHFSRREGVEDLGEVHFP
jgi:hypothetical protein